MRAVESFGAAANSAISSCVDPIASSPLTGLSQIFVVNSPWTGVGIAIATAVHSPMLALHAVGGSATGCLVRYFLGADASAIIDGLWEYNSCLASMAVGVFFVGSTRTTVLSVSSAAVSAALFGAMAPAFGTYGVPCLTLAVLRGRVRIVPARGTRPRLGTCQGSSFAGEEYAEVRVPHRGKGSPLSCIAQRRCYLTV